MARFRNGQRARDARWLSEFRAQCGVSRALPFPTGVASLEQRAAACVGRDDVRGGLPVRFARAASYSYGWRRRPALNGGNGAGSVRVGPTHWSPLPRLNARERWLSDRGVHAPKLCLPEAGCCMQPGCELHARLWAAASLPWGFQRWAARIDPQPPPLRRASIARLQLQGPRRCRSRDDGHASNVDTFAMSGKAWRTAAEASLRAAREAEMPGVPAAREKAAAEAEKQRKANVQAQEREQKQIAGARDERVIEQSLQSLQLDPGNAQQAMEKANDPATQKKLRACAGQLGLPMKGADVAFGAAMKILSAQAEGEHVRERNMQALEIDRATGLESPTTLLLEQAERGAANVGQLRQSMQQIYPEVQIFDCWKLGADGSMKYDASIQLDGKPYNVQNPMYRAVYCLQISKLPAALLTAVKARECIKLMNIRFQAHIVPITGANWVSVTVTQDTRVHLQALMMQLAALSCSGIDAEATLLGLLRRSAEKGPEVQDVHMDRELVPAKHIQSKADYGTPPAVPLQAPLPGQARPQNQRFAIAVPGALGARQGGAGRLVLISPDAGKLRQDPISIESATGKIVFMPDAQPMRTETAMYGLEAARKTAAQRAAAASRAPEVWLQRALAAVHEGTQQNTVASPVPIGQLSSRMHPRAAQLIEGLITYWKAQCARESNASSAKRANENIEAKIRAAKAEIDGLDTSLVGAEISLPRTITGVEWRQIFNIPQGLAPAARSFENGFEALCDTLQETAKLHIAAAEMIINQPTRTGAPWPQGVKGEGVLAAMLVWNSEVQAFKSTAAEGHQTSNKVKIMVTANGREVELTVRFHQNSIMEEPTSPAQAMVERAILDKLAKGGVIFVPTTMQDGTINNLEGAVSECPALADKAEMTHDIRADNFVPGAEYDKILMPTMRRLIDKDTIAPVISSSSDRQLTMAYMLSDYAKAVQTAGMDWSAIRHGTNIQEQVRSLLQPSFVAELTRKAATGLWTTKELVSQGYQRAEAGAGEPPDMAVDILPMNNSLANMSHPFARDGTAVEIMAQLAPRQLIVLEMPQAALILMRPSQEDLIAMLQDDETTLVTTGGKIRYETIKPSVELVTKASEEIVKGLRAREVPFFWLLAAPDATAGRINIEDCQARYQNCSVESIGPTASEILPDNIWSSKGPIWSAAVKALDQAGTLQVFPVSPSKHGRKGMIAVGQQDGKPVSDRYGEDLEEELIDIQVGDNETLAAKLSSRDFLMLKRDIRQALQQPQVLLGANVQAGSTLMVDDKPFEQPGQRVPHNLDLMYQLGRVKEQDRQDILKALGQLWALRNPPCSVLQCMQGILLVPPNHQLLEIPHIIQRALTWNPREHELNSLYDAAVLQEPLQQVAAGDDAEEHAMPVEGVFNDMLKKLQTMKRDRSKEGSEMDRSNADSGLLAIKSATASEAFSEHFRAENAIRDDGREWAIPAGSENSITYTLELDEPKEILGLGLAHRVEPRWKFFKQCYVQMPGRRASENKLTFTESREVQIAMLRERFISSSVEIKFPSDQISTGEGTPGLRGIMLIGCDPAEDGGKKRRT